MKIDDWRRKIDAIDTAMLHLLNLRTELALEVGRFKNEEGVALRVPEREREILTRLKGINPGPLDGEAIETIYQLILDQSVRAQQMHGLGRVAEKTREGASPTASKPNGKENRGVRGISRKSSRV